MGHLKPNPGEGKTSAMIKYLFLFALFGAVFCEPEPEAAPVAKSDPSADPYYYYGGYPYYYGRHYYGGYYGHRYYGLLGRKRREAEPEPVPNAEADPKADPYYYYYGLGLGHYGGYYGYPYVYYGK